MNSNKKKRESDGYQILQRMPDELSVKTNFKNNDDDKCDINK